jgi:hypothetical protein
MIMIWALGVVVLIIALATQNELMLIFAFLWLAGALGWTVRRWLE